MAEGHYITADLSMNLSTVYSGCLSKRESMARCDARKGSNLRSGVRVAGNGVKGKQHLCVCVSSEMGEGLRPTPSCHPDGGCQPATAHCRRAGTINSLFMRRATTVARPVGGRPMIWPPSSLQRKWSDQLCVRGLNRGTSVSVNGSTAWVCAPLKLLHQAQAFYRLASSDVPLWARGTI